MLPLDMDMLAMKNQKAVTEKKKAWTQVQKTIPNNIQKASLIISLITIQTIS